MTKANFWVCGCPSNNGEHINETLYSACIYCGKHKSDALDIVVPSGMGGIFTVVILARMADGCLVQVVDKGFNTMRPFLADFESISPRWKGAVK